MNARSTREYYEIHRFNLYKWNKASEPKQSAAKLYTEFTLSVNDKTMMTMHFRLISLLLNNKLNLQAYLQAKLLISRLQFLPTHAGTYL